MNRHGIIWTGMVILLGALLVGGSGSALAAEEFSWTAWKDSLPFPLTGEVEVGGQIVKEGGDSATFDEYRDLDSTVDVYSLRLRSEDKARTQFLEFGGTYMSRTDASYYLNAGRYNYYRFNFEFDRLPHNIANNASTIYVEPVEGNFRILGGAVGSGLAGPLNVALSTPPTLAQRNAIVAAVNRNLQPTELGFQTDKANFGFNWLPLPELEVGLGYTFTMRDGKTPWGTVIGSPGSGAVELAAPRDERFHEIKAGAEYVRDWYQLRFNYTFGMFENDVSKIEWDNPCGAGTGGCRNPSGFGRFSTMPENYAHTFSGAGGVTLPWWRTRVAGGFSYSLWHQDDTFLPWTTVTGFTGNTTAAGATSPDAKMDVLQANVNLTTRPLRNVTANVRYRYFELDNNTAEHTFINVLSPGDTTPGAGTHTSEPLAYRKQNVSTDVAWRIIPQVTAKVGYEYDHWNRAHREVASSNENLVKGVLDVQPLPWLLGRFSYTHGVRTIGANGYEPLGGNATALPQFRKFDEADRTRDRADILLQITPIDTLTLSGSFFGQDDNYFNSAYGLQEAQAFGWSADVSWAPVQRVNLYAGYGHDEYKSQEQSCNVGTAPPTPCNPLDTFFISPRDILDTVRAGVNFVVIPQRLDLDVGFSWSYGQSKYGVGAVPGGVAAGQPAPVDDVTNELYLVHVVARLFLTPNWTLKVGYQYERYNESDFTTDGIPPSLAALPVQSAADARTIILGAQHPPYDANIVGFWIGYKF
jgi:MtrB/PioB family decaheme-associated outer membrane protein